MPERGPRDGAILANGGRVLNVCASGKTVTEAQRRAYQAVDRIKWPEGFCRRDIGVAGGGAGAGEGLVALHRHCERAKRRSNPSLPVRGSGLLRFARNDDYNKSPPAALAVVPCSRNALMTFLPIFHLCTSSGPSTSRCERTWVYHLASGVSWLKPSAP